MLLADIMFVSGDGEGGIEMTGSMQLIREFCDIFVTPEKATRTRIVSAQRFFTVLSVFFKRYNTPRHHYIMSLKNPKFLLNLFL